MIFYFVVDDDDYNDYHEWFDPEQFLQDGNDIRFQLPSQNPDLTLSRDESRTGVTLKRRKTTAIRRKSTKRAPPIGTKRFTVTAHHVDLLPVFSCRHLPFGPQSSVLRSRCKLLKVAPRWEWFWTGCPSCVKPLLMARSLGSIWML